MAYRRNHIATAGYLRAWTEPDGRLQAVSKTHPASRSRRPAKVAFRDRFFAAEVAPVAEQRLAAYEVRGVEALRRLRSRWPLDAADEDRHRIACLIAIHLWRNPAGQRQLLRVQQHSLGRRLPEYAARWTPSQLESFLREVSSPRFLVEMMLDDLLKGGSVIASMHWTILEFADTLLATSDQPVGVMPLLDQDGDAPIMPTPATGLIGSEEVRFPVGPRHALLMTWLSEPDDGPPLRVGDDIAANLNRSVIAQADKEWFHHPARRPTTLVPGDFAIAGCSPLGSALLDRYDRAHAHGSRRRVDAGVGLERLIEEGQTGQMIVAGVRRVSA